MHVLGQVNLSLWIIFFLLWETGQIGQSEELIKWDSTCYAAWMVPDTIYNKDTLHRAC